MAASKPSSDSDIIIGAFWLFAKESKSDDGSLAALDLLKHRWRNLVPVAKQHYCDRYKEDLKKKLQDQIERPPGATQSTEKRLTRSQSRAKGNL